MYEGHGLGPREATAGAARGRLRLPGKQRCGTATGWLRSPGKQMCIQALGLGPWDATEHRRVGVSPRGSGCTDGSQSRSNSPLFLKFLGLGLYAQNSPTIVTTVHN